MNARPHKYPVDDISVSSAIKQEIQRFESVHPSIYSLYDLIDELPALGVPLEVVKEFRNNVVYIEDAFVNSQEWTVTRKLRDIRLGVLGSEGSGKTALVNRYLTGTYISEESPEGGRFKKEIVVDGQNYLLLVRDEAGKPELEFAGWFDAVILVFSLDSESSFAHVYSYFTCLSHFRDMIDVPVVVVGTQDAISETSPRAVTDARIHRLTTDLHNCTYHETCAMYGLNIERVFLDICQKVIRRGAKQPLTSTPTPFTRQLSIPVTRSHAYQMQVAAKRPTHVNGDDVAAFSRGRGLVAPPAAAAMTSAAPGSHRSRLTSDENRRTNRTSLMCKNDSFQMASSDSRETVSTENDDCLQKLPSKVSAVPDVVAKKSASLPEHVAHGVLQQRQQQISDSKSSAVNAMVTPVLYRKHILSSKNVQKSHSFNGLVAGHRASMPPSHDALPEIPSPSVTPVLGRKKAGSKSFQDHLMQSGGDRSVSSPNATPNMSRKHRRANFFGKKNDEEKKNRDEKSNKQRGTPVKQGILYKKSGKPLSKEWKKKYAALMDDGHLVYYSSYNDFLEDTHSKEIVLGRTTVKFPGGKPRGCEISKPVASTPTDGNTSAGDLASTVPLPLAAAGVSKSTETPVLPAVKKKHRRARSSARNDVSVESDDGFEFSIVSLDGKQWSFEATTAEERDDWMLAIEQQIRSSLLMIDSHKSKTQVNTVSTVLLATRIRSVSGNSVCADCSAPNPDWASINLGVVLCIECSGIHRNLGTHLTRIRSLDLDDWPVEIVLVMNAIGNDVSNAVFEADIGSHTKPSASSPREEKDRWIRAKYDQREFLPPLPYRDIALSQQLIDAVARQDVNKTILVLSHCGTSNRDQVSGQFSMTDWRTALHITAYLGNIVILQLLLWSGADARALDHEGRDPLYYATISESASAPMCARLLHTSHGCRDSLIT